MMAKLLLDSDASESEDGGALLAEGSDFRVNEDFARRFTHNKKREELIRRKKFCVQNHTTRVY